MKIRMAAIGKCIAIVSVLGFAALGAHAQQAQQNKTTASASASDPTTKTSTSRPASKANNSWVDNKSYVIGENDMLDIDVWKEKEISRTIPVRPDGKISLPLIGEIRAAGLTPLQLQDDITEKLKAYIENPEVTVIVDDPRSHVFNIVGEVNRPATYPLNGTITVLDAIAEAGGFKDFAKETKIYVLRPMPGGIRVRIPFNYKDVIKGKNIQENVTLKPGDTIVVP